MKRLERFGITFFLSMIACAGLVVLVKSTVIVSDNEGLLAGRYPLGTVEAYIIRGYDITPFVAGMLLVGLSATLLASQAKIKRFSPLEIFSLVSLLLIVSCNLLILFF